MTRRTIEPLWTVEEVSAYLGVPVATLYQWRHRRVGPPASRVGRHLRYDAADVRAWLVERQAS
ncbi:helix-turn-helix domain-containing protein [Micromonospora sp. NPDC127501]|uniref:helix-turn-helix transcriptional regulator n=1 Tax=Micromonospora sp. NPDC127501 TaxID=3154872 RepID=UPI00332B04F4